MNIKQLIISILAILSLVPSHGQTQRRDSIIVSLITCWPGPEVYELCGHEAVRVRGIKPDGSVIDSVWNYGTFDFAQPNFIYRFVKGETDYMLTSYPFAFFLPEYAAQGRRMVEQDLNLTRDEAWRLLGMLRTEARPENRTYRYNYVKDNCATRIVDRIDQAVGQPVIYPDSVLYGTFRNEMRAYHRDYPWYQFGIDLALGSGIDYPLRGREEMFVPLEMMRKADGAHMSDGRPLVAETRTLVEGIPDATLGPTHWSATPIVCCSLFLLAVLGVCWLQWRRRVIYRAVYSIWFALIGLTGCVLAFLVFVSEHEATSPNILLLWLNPLQLIIAAGIWWRRRWRIPVIVMTYVDITLLTVMLIVWPFQTQSANPAFFPLMAATLALAVTYAIISPKISYKSIGNTRRNEEVGNLGAGGSGHARRGRTDGSRKTTARGGNRR